MNGSQAGKFDLVFDVPSECARHLATGEVDVGLIPVIEYIRIPNLRVIPDISIASKRRVRSVLFVSKRPIEEVRHVAVDSSSRTSTMLLRVVLDRFYGRKDVRFEVFPPTPSEMLEKTDAALLIGNPALKVSTDGLLAYDLAREWYKFTGLPFVFAFWAVREEVNIEDHLEAFYSSRREGLESIDEMAETYSARLGLSPDSIRSYLRSNLDYTLGEDNLRGLTTFLELAVDLGVSNVREAIRFCS